MTHPVSLTILPFKHSLFLSVFRYFKHYFLFSLFTDFLAVFENSHKSFTQTWTRTKTSGGSFDLPKTIYSLRLRSSRNMALSILSLPPLHCQSPWQLGKSAHHSPPGKIPPWPTYHTTSTLALSKRHPFPSTHKEGKTYPPGGNRVLLYLTLRKKLRRTWRREVSRRSQGAALLSGTVNLFIHCRLSSQLLFLALQLRLLCGRSRALLSPRLIHYLQGGNNQPLSKVS